MSDSASDAEPTPVYPHAPVRRSTPIAPPVEPTVVGAKGPRAASKQDLLDNQPTRALRRPVSDDSPTRTVRPDADAGTENTHRRPRSRDPAAPMLDPGTRLGRYLIVEHVGSGGVGDVYKAYDPELDRRIAIKLLRPEVVAPAVGLGDPTLRLRREAQALAKLRHPNVVVVHDVGTFEDEVFIAMEFAEGRTLLPWARAHEHAWPAVRDMMARAGEGLAAAHDAGLVHRDFKPANVVVDDDARVTVLDFGLARAADAEPATSEPTETSFLLGSEVTSGSLLLGTPPYMAPELFAGEPATPASDQFAFCVTLYRVLFDRLPFVARSQAEFCELVRRGDPNFIGNSLPGWLVRVIARGMAAEPSRRFESMKALLAALHTDRRRRRRGLLGLALAVPLLGVGSGVGVWVLRPQATAEERAVTETLANEARTAAARGYYVHPPPEDPETPTALTKVLQLEALEGAIESEAETLAGTLRDEFAAALIRLGDRYYDRAGGAPFAADFYAAALVFRPDDAHAGGRVAISEAQLASLVARAQSGSFSELELAAAQPLSILAEAEPTEREDKLRRFLDAEGRAPAGTRALLEDLVRSDPQVAEVVAARGGKARKGSSAAPGPAVDLEDVLLDPDALAAAEGGDDEAGAVPTDTADLDTAPARGSGRGGAGEPTAAASGSTRDPKQAAAEAKLGKQALATGDLAGAAKHFHRALQHDRRSVGALQGLATLHYEKGEYAKAVKFAERARGAAPKSTSLLLLIGDARYKMLEYGAARKAYERAEALGSGRATERLERLASRLGE